MENKNEDKVVKVETIERPMTVKLTSGETVSTGGKVIYTHYASGRKDCKVIVTKI